MDHRALFLLFVAACAAKADDDTASDTSDLSAPTQFENPILPMEDRPPGVGDDIPKGVPHAATEGCPDPSAIRTRGGDYYVYCTSYTFRGSRLSGFPIWKSRSKSVAGPYKRAGALIPEEDNSRKAWPSWVDHDNGDFWGPDVKQLPSGKFYAGYSAPCENGSRCVGIAWSDSAEGPWTHAGKAFIRPDNNGNGSGNAYDPSLLVTSAGDLYLYWVVVGKGVYGAKVTANPSGELQAVNGSDAHLIANREAGQRGEGPFVIEHKGAFYEFYSTGSLLYGYHVGVRRGTDPLQPFDDEAPNLVVRAGSKFVATGGNSIVSDDNTDFLVYHAIVAPSSGGCPHEDPVYGGNVKKVPANEDGANPYCRVQGERQAMIDPLVWKAAAGGIEWPSLANGTGQPSVGNTAMP